MLMLDGANLGRLSQKSLASATRLHEVLPSASVVVITTTTRVLS